MIDETLDAIGEGKRRRAAHAEQKRLADQLAGDWRRTRGFSDGQRRALIGFAAGMLICVAIGLLRHRQFVPDPLPPEAPRFAELADRIDPNTADAATLSALPQLGEGRAKAIVEYREQRRTGDPTRAVFRNAEDLMRVDGIGAALKAQMEPHLTFPPAAPSAP